MTQKLEKRKRESGKACQHAQSSSIDPQMVALVKYLARRAAERDYDTILNASLKEAISSEEDSLGKSGADS